MRAYGQKLVQFCTHTHTRVSFSSIDAVHNINDYEPVLAGYPASLGRKGGREGLRGWDGGRKGRRGWEAREGGKDGGEG